MLSSNGHIILQDLLSEMARSDATLPHPAIGLLENGVRDRDIPQDIAGFPGMIGVFSQMQRHTKTAAALGDELGARPQVGGAVIADAGEQYGKLFFVVQGSLR